METAKYKVNKIVSSGHNDENPDKGDKRNDKQHGEDMVKNYIGAADKINKDKRGIITDYQ